MAELIEEAKELVKKGYKEIILLAQNVNSYGKGLSENETFANLLQNICDIEGDFIIRFVSPHPRDFTDDVIDVIAKNPKIARCTASAFTVWIYKSIKTYEQRIFKRAVYCSC